MPLLNKFDVYVDESGQDTLGNIFFVAIVVVSEKREELRELLRDIEKSSRKTKKWTKTTSDRRVQYINRILKEKKFLGKIYFSYYFNSREYVDLTILSTAKAILDFGDEEYLATVYVDGLSKNERQRFAAGLRKLRVKTKLTRGARDESEEFIRLADAIAGFVRDGTEKDKTMKPLFDKACGKGIIKEI
ncbi:MAG: DUF3800 domain-containing protein [bacterium]|nr:DUF3800 domain-containing protein [bacterium]